ncbi:MAG: hypothetical protein FWF69_01145 [Firmicutes bacterium]|nr:hypothetical protein [Bacillota bacterium]
MLMDIACPAELLGIEQAEFGDGRRQAYLTFQSETDKLITAVSGRMTLLGENCDVVEHRQVCFEDLSARPEQKFTCHLALDGFPLFDTAEISLEHVAFAGEAPWMLSTRRLIDCTPPPLQDGPERVALVALAGRDAACFPERRDSLWICVCGRYNRWRWSACRRCGRGRDETLDAFTPERVLAEYHEAVESIRARDQRRLLERAAQGEAERARARVQMAEKIARKRRIDLWARRVIAAVLGVLLLSLLVWGAHKLFGSSASDPPPAEMPVPAIDYLDTL